MRPDRAGRAPLLDEYIVLQEGANDHRIRAIIEFDGRIEEDRLRAALLASFAIVPLLGAAYVRRRGHGRW